MQLLENQSWWIFFCFINKTQILDLPHIDYCVLALVTTVQTPSSSPRVLFSPIAPQRYTGRSGSSNMATETVSFIISAYIIQKVWIVAAVEILLTYLVVHTRVSGRNSSTTNRSWQRGCPDHWNSVLHSPSMHANFHHPVMEIRRQHSRNWMGKSTQY